MVVYSTQIGHQTALASSGTDPGNPGSRPHVIPLCHIQAESADFHGIVRPVKTIGAHCAHYINMVAIYRPIVRQGVFETEAGIAIKTGLCKSVAKLSTFSFVQISITVFVSLTLVKLIAYVRS